MNSVLFVVKSFFVLTFFVAIFAVSAFAIPSGVVVTEVAGTTGPLTYTAYNSPAINEKGEVCFKGSSKTISAIVKFDGTQRVAAAESNDGSGLYDQFTSGLCSINDNGDVAFDSCKGCKVFDPSLLPLVNTPATLAATDVVEFSIFTRLFSAGAPAPLQTVASTGAGESDFKTVVLPSINNAGIVSFTGALQNGVEGIWLRNGPAVSGVLDSNGPFVRFGGAAINNANQITFGGQEDAGDARGIYGPAANRLIGTFNGFTKFSLSSINSAGTVATLGLKAASATDQNPESGVYLDGQPFILNRGEFDVADISAFQAVAINDLNDVVFSGIKANGTQVIFLYAKGGLIPLLQQGETIPGYASPVAVINVSREAINNARQIVLVVTLEDQTEFVLRLDTASLFIPPDNCPSDNAKFEPGICGCGVADVDSNNDGIFNCKVTPTILGYVTQISDSLKKVKKLSSKAKKAKKLEQKALQKDIKAMLAQLTSLANGSSTIIKLASTKVSVAKLVSTLRSKVLRGLKTGEEGFSANRKKGLTELKKFSQALVVS